jgi:twitching motility protein PilT
MPEFDDELSQIVAQLNRAAPSQQKTTSASRGPESTASLDQLLATAAGRHASDVLLIAGAPAMFRVTGALTPASSTPLDAEDVRSLVLPLLEPAQAEELRTRRSVDLSFQRENLGRFRINIHHQRGTLAASIRLLPTRIPRWNRSTCRPRWRNWRTGGRDWCWSPDPRAAGRVPRSRR